MGKKCEYEGTFPMSYIVRAKNVSDICINWYSMQQKVANLKHGIRDLMKCGEGHGMMEIK